MRKKSATLAWLEREHRIKALLTRGGFNLPILGRALERRYSADGGYMTLQWSKENCLLAYLAHHPNGMTIPLLWWQLE